VKISDLVAKVQDKTGLDTADSTKAVVVVLNAVREAIDSPDEKIAIVKLGVFLKRKIAGSAQIRIVFRPWETKGEKKQTGSAQVPA